MKKVVILAGILLLGGTSLYAASSDSITLTVTIQHLAVEISEESYDFGVVLLGSTTLSSTGITVTNTGNVNETYSLNLTNPPGWTASQTGPGEEIYVLDAAFATSPGAITWSHTNHALSETSTICTSTKFAGDQTGVNVPPGETRTLWFRFLAPTSTTVTNQQSVQVTITAQAA